MAFDPGWLPPRALLHMDSGGSVSAGRVGGVLLASVLQAAASTLSTAPALLSVTEVARELQLYVRSLCTTIAPFCIVTRCALPLGHF